MNWIKLFATFFYSGLSPKAPGTVGTLAAIPLVFFAYTLGRESYVAITVLLVIFSIFICQLYEQRNEVHDSSEIVIDEVAGFLITMALIPLSFKSLVLGFLLFRLFDILKPFPISLLDKKVQGGFGVVVDDLVAGLFANIILQMLHQKWALI